jgi:hypothetical protein
MLLPCCEFVLAYGEYKYRMLLHQPAASSGNVSLISTDPNYGELLGRQIYCQLVAPCSNHSWSHRKSKKCTPCYRLLPCQFVLYVGNRMLQCQLAASSNNVSLIPKDPNQAHVTIS